MKKKIIIICTIILIIAIGVLTYFIIKTSNTKKYQNTDTYKLNGEEITSVKTVLGETQLKKYSKTAETLELTFKDENKQQSAEKYIKYLLENGNYIKANLEDENKQQISKSANNSNNIVIVETQNTDDGFKVTIQVGPGQIKIDPIE